MGDDDEATGDVRQRQTQERLRGRRAAALERADDATSGILIGKQWYPFSDPAARELYLSTEQRAGLALSGGGIRSATISLGLAEALASRGRLYAFDMVSTVSGGAAAQKGSAAMPEDTTALDLSWKEGLGEGDGRFATAAHYAADDAEAAEHQCPGGRLRSRRGPIDTNASIDIILPEPVTVPGIGIGRKRVRRAKWHHILPRTLKDDPIASRVQRPMLTGNALPTVSAAGEGIGI